MRRAGAWCALALAACAGLPCAAKAQSNAEELTGIKTVGFLVENPGEGALKCGVTRQAIEREVKSVIGRSHLRIGSMKNSDGYVYINVNAIYAPPIDYCAFNVAVRFNTFGDARTRYGEGYFEMTLFDRAAVGMFRRERAAAQIRDMTDRLLAGFVEEWSRANSASGSPKPAKGSVQL